MVHHSVMDPEPLNFSSGGTCILVWLWAGWVVGCCGGGGGRIWDGGGGRSAWVDGGATVDVDEGCGVGG